jgi:hypothetical protein
MQNGPVFKTRPSLSARLRRSLSVTVSNPMPGIAPSSLSYLGLALRSVSCALLGSALSLGWPAIASATEVLTLQVRGDILASCGFAGPEGLGSAPAPAILAFQIDPAVPGWQDASVRLPLRVRCNQQFRLLARPASGALIQSSAGAAVIGGRFSRAIGYRLIVDLTTENPLQPINLDCTFTPGHDPIEPCAASSGRDAAIGPGAGEGQLTIQLPGAAPTPLAGTYRETVVLSLLIQ